MSGQNLVHVCLAVHRAIDIITPNLVNAVILGLVHDVSLLALKNNREFFG